MTNSKMTRRALLTSVMALVLCFAMLTGTTFAWFTDQETSANNRIVAGNLDVDLLMYNGTEYVSIANGNGDIFKAGTTANNSNATLWEPGKTQIAYLAIENKGNLDLKYKVELNVKDPENGKLYEVMTYTITPDAKNVDLPAWDATKAIDVKLGKQDVSEEVKLGNGATHYFALSMHMSENAGKDYMNDYVIFDLTVYATQLDSESDAFGPEYDEPANWGDPWDGTADESALTYDAATDTYTVKDGEGLAALANKINGTTQMVNLSTDADTNVCDSNIVLEADIDLQNKPWTPIGQTGAKTFYGTFDGQGYTIYNLYVDSSEMTTEHYATGLFGFIDAGAATISNLNFENATVIGHHYVGVIAGFMTGEVSNCTVKNSTVTATYANDDADGDKAGAIVGYVNSKTVIKNNTVSNCEIKGNRDIGGIAGAYNGTELTGNKVVDTEITYITEKSYASAGAIISGRTGYVADATNVATNVTIMHEVSVSSAADLQAALDNAKDRTTILLAPDVNYGVVYMGRPTKNNDTKMTCNTHSYSTTNAEEFKTHLADGQWHTTPEYITTLKDLTVIGAKGATIAGLVATSGHMYGDVYDYVRDVDYDLGSAYYNTLNIENVVFSNVNFTGKIDINTSDATSVYDGVTFDGCSFTTAGIASANGAAIRYYNEANNGNVKNIAVKNCTFNYCYQGVYVQNVNGVSVTDCTFNTTGHNAIAIQSTNAPVALKNVVITGNTFEKINDRVIRFGQIGADSNITIQNNTATNSGGEDGEVMKAVSIEAGITTSISNNTWNGVVANDELKD